ncbi:Hypothetical predicted protein [Marmota monax]|uniref:non-specific serine/threonine protein kinase n=1 Tax=Marmota monax TaxID=9995 RepID=A0A5E4ARC2_MARMO|nr:hypothetical protein GHT09_013841 [Marmota monax]VTJ59725.1 Hypothetical predicted protein [Marmota monax]
MQVGDSYCPHPRGRWHTGEGMFRQIPYAICYCHKKGIAHRDLKLENILVDVGGNIKIVDFGLDNRFMAEQKLDAICGTLPYCALELYQWEGYDSPTVDIWSLGIVLFFMVIGCPPPFNGITFLQLKEQILHARYSIPSPASTEVQSVISQLLTIHPRRGPL